MKRTSIVVGLLAAMLWGGGSGLAADLSLDRYVELSIARLELAEQSWSATGQPPSPDAMAVLFARYGLSEADFIAYTSAHREAIDAYLAAHEDSRQRIEDLRARTERAIRDQPK